MLINLQEKAVELITNIAKQTVRYYATYNYGRDIDENNLSVVVATSKAKDILGQIRINLPKGLIAFIGTSKWLGNENYRKKVEIVIAEFNNQFEVLKTDKFNLIDD